MSLYLLFLAGSVLFILVVSWLSLFCLCIVGLKISTSLHGRAHGLPLVFWLVAAWCLRLCMGELMGCLCYCIAISSLFFQCGFDVHEFLHGSLYLHG
jgi:hypothetical protein